MKLRELIESVREKKLSKEQLELYRDDLSILFAEMTLELAEIEKLEALYTESSGENTAIGKKIKWKATKEGLREIELKRYCLATKELLNSLKSRLYSLY